MRWQVGSRAAGAASGVERCFPEGDEESEDYYDDEDRDEVARVKYKAALRRLQKTFPELDVSPMLAVARASEQPTRPCPCGAGVLPKWPWVVQTVDLGFCGCDMAGWELTCWRAEWIMAGAPNLAW